MQTIWITSCWDIVTLLDVKIDALAWNNLNKSKITLALLHRVLCNASIFVASSKSGVAFSAFSEIFLRRVKKEIITRID